MVSVVYVQYVSSSEVVGWLGDGKGLTVSPGWPDLTVEHTLVQNSFSCFSLQSAAP